MGTRMRRIRFADVIDLEVQLARDESEASQAKLRLRDREIANRINAEDRQEPGLSLRWLDEMRKADGELPGQRVEGACRALGGALVVLGLLLGFGLVWGWLTLDQSQPVNVIHFWSVTVGLPAGLFVLWVVGLVLRQLPWFSRWAGPMSSAIPELLQWMLAKRFSQWRQWLAAAGGASKRTRTAWLWMVHTLTQRFALAFGIGAVAALVAAFYLTDPAFGWRSRLMDTQQLHRVVSAITWPWASVMPSATLTEVQIEQTQYSSMGERFADVQAGRGQAGHATWAMWWPMVLMSMVVYVLLPRAAAVVGTSWALKRAAARAFDPLRLAPLRQRLAPAAEFRTSAKYDHKHIIAQTQQAPQAALQNIAGQRCHVLQWTGLGITRQQVAAHLQQRFALQVDTHAEVGQLDPDADAQAMHAATQGKDEAEPVMVIVPAWEPPTSEYRDFLAGLRKIAGERRPIEVLLYEQHAGEPEQVNAEDQRTWQQMVRSMGDAYLSVLPFVEEA